MRQHFKTDLPISVFYKDYLEKTKDKDKKYKVTSGQYSKVIKMAHDLIAKGIIEDNFIFSPPYLKCRIRIKKYKQPVKFDENGKIIKSNLPVNWKATKEYWEKNPIAKEKKILIYHLNDHSDGYRYRFSKFLRKDSNANLRYYNFKPSRRHDRALAKHILNPLSNSEYYE